MNPGVYPEMPRSEYDKILRHNQSTLKKWMELGSIPSEFAHWRSQKQKEKKECFLIGDAFDCTLLNPVEFDKRFAIAPKCDRRFIAGKEIWKQFESTVNGRSILTDDQANLVSEMALSIYQSKSVSDIFQYCKKAVLIGDLFGFPCKAEIDLWDGGNKTEHIWDVKQLKDVSRKGFKQAFVDYGYDIQATFYLSLAMSLGFEKTVFSFICVKNSPPYTVRVHSFQPKEKPRHDLLYNICLSEIQAALEELDRRIKSNDFNDDDDWESIEIPEWRLRVGTSLNV
jgi:PDDEXK-like domain of unknown function (DUF3799)